MTFSLLFVLQIATRRVHFAGCTTNPDGPWLPQVARNLTDTEDGSPNWNTPLERFHRSLKEDCLDRMIFFGETSLRNAVREYLAHDHAERNHQGLENRLIEPSPEVGRTIGAIERRDRLGGMLRYYYRKAT